MELEALLLCDAATVSGGKLNILGAFDQIQVKELPSVHRSSSVAIRLIMYPEDKGEHNISVRIVDENDTDIIPKFEGTVQVEPKEGTFNITRVNIVIEFQQMKFTNFGNHFVKLIINNKLLQKNPFFVKRFPSNENN
jgi:hypothetical protein